MDTNDEDEEYLRRPASDYYDYTKVSIYGSDPREDTWLCGRVMAEPDYTFEAKIFDVGSKYGIDGGRISKLHLTKWDSKGVGKEVAIFDRGWIEGGKPPFWDLPTRKALREIKAAFSKDVEPHPGNAPQDRADLPERAIPAAPEQQATERPANPMEFFKKREAEPSHWEKLAATVPDKSPDMTPAPAPSKDRHRER